MARPKVCIYAPVDPDGRSHAALAAAGCEVVVGPGSASLADLRMRGSGASALMGATFRGGVMDESVFAAMPELRLISKYTIGFDDVDLDAATARGILVTHCPTESNWGGVAEGTVAAVLALLKKVRERDRQVREGRWRDPGLAGTYLGARQDGYPGITIGLVGLGRIGARVAELLAPWHIRLLASDPYVADARFVLHGAVPVDLPTLLREADVVSLHCSLTAETRGLIGARELALMKPGAVLVNTARGALVDQDALCACLARGGITAAALDVLAEEPPPHDSALLELGDRVLLSPHMVAANAGSPLRAATAWANESTLRALRGELPQRICNREAISLWRQRFEGRSLLGARAGAARDPTPT